MSIEPQQQHPDTHESLILDLLIRHYPAQLSQADLTAQLARRPDDPDASIATQDGLKQLQADRLVRCHGRYWAASYTAVRAYELFGS